ncbi:hypothetical protein PybrP1_008028 [[Pythium] brassicae (nom. inval.)]|nr:hypothetical protein PybrP1_008028 [[Pythium] brassicae (nom. inval.)]
MGKRSVDAPSAPSFVDSKAGCAGAPAETPSALSGPTSVSAVWSYFERDTAGNSVCKLCARVIKGQHSSNLLSHLRTAGRTDAAHQQANHACEEHRESKRAVKKQKSITPEDLAAVYPQIAAALAKQATAVAAPAGLALPPYVAAPSVPAAVPSQRESRAAAYGALQPSALALSQDQIAQDLALAAVVDNLPLNFAAKPGFQFFLQQLLGEKRLAVPSEDAVAKSVLLLHESVVHTTKEAMRKAQSVGVSLEMWSVPAVAAARAKQFVAIKVHFSANFRAQDAVLGCVPVDEVGSVEGLSAVLHQHFERANIKDKVVAVVSDSVPLLRHDGGAFSAADLPSAFSGAGLDGRAAGPSDAAQATATIMLKSAPAYLRAALTKRAFSKSFPAVVGSIEAFVGRLAANKDAYAAYQSAHPFVDLAADATSYFELLRDLQDSLPALEQLARDYELAFLDTPAVEWVGTMVKKLRPFARYVDALEGEQRKKTGSDKEVNKSGLSSVSTLAAALVTYAERQAGADALPPHMNPPAWKQFFLQLARELRAQFASLPPVCYAATLFDPRYKDKESCYLSPASDTEAGKAYLRRLFAPEKEGSAGTRASSGGSGGGHEPHAKLSSSWQSTDNNDDDEDDDLLAHLPSGVADSASADSEFVVTWQRELAGYLSLPLADRNADPLGWWKANQLRFPLIAPYAEVVLALPAAASSGETVRVDVRQVLLRAQGATSDPALATNRALLEAFLCFQKNKASALEWFRSSSSGGNTPAETDGGSNSLKHSENV